MIKLLKNNVKCQGQGHNDACLWKGIDLSNNLCECDVNQLKNEKEENDAAQLPAHPTSPIFMPKFFFEKSG